MDPKKLTSVSVEKKKVFLIKRGRGGRLLKRPREYNPVIFRPTIPNVKRTKFTIVKKTNKVQKVSSTKQVSVPTTIVEPRRSERLASRAVNLPKTN